MFLDSERNRNLFHIHNYMFIEPRRFAIKGIWTLKPFHLPWQNRNGVWHIALNSRTKKKIIIIKTQTKNTKDGH